MTADRQDDLAFYGRACKLARLCCVIAVAGLILTPAASFVQAAVSKQLLSSELPRYDPFSEPLAWTIYSLSRFLAGGVGQYLRLVSQVLSGGMNNWLLLLVAAIALRLLAQLAVREVRPAWMPPSSDSFAGRATAVALGCLTLIVAVIHSAGLAAGGGFGRSRIAPNPLTLSIAVPTLANSLRSGMLLIVAGSAVLALLRISRKPLAGGCEKEVSDGD